MKDRRSDINRRTNEERRRPKERRRNAENRMAVIELTESGLKAAIITRGTAEKPDVVEGFSYSWKQGAMPLTTEAGRLELTAALRHFSESQKLVGSQVRIVLGGKYCVTRALLGNTEEVKAQLQQIQQRSQLYLLLGTGEKVVVSNSMSLDARHTYTIAAIANSKTIEAIHQASEQAGLVLESIEPALVANSRIVGRLENCNAEPCLLIHLEKDTAEIGILHDGRLLLEYRPGDCQTASELVAIVRTHLNRLERHIGRMLNQAPPKLRRIYLTGERDKVFQAQKELKTISDLQVSVADPQQVQSTWILSPGAEDTVTVTLLGGVLGNYLPQAEYDAPNFMDHITAITRIPLQPILLRSLLPLVAVFLVAVGLLVFNYHQKVGNENLQNQLIDLADVRTRARELQLKTKGATAKLEEVSIMLRQIKFQDLAVMMRRIAGCMSSDVWVSSIKVSHATQVELLGASYLEAGVYDFVRWLELAPGFADVALRRAKSAASRPGQVVEFEVGLVFSEENTPILEVASNE